eukprot:146673-Amorphochlora_amoeboformis.AAC.1
MIGCVEERGGNQRTYHLPCAIKANCRLLSEREHGFVLSKSSKRESSAQTFVYSIIQVAYVVLPRAPQGRLAEIPTQLKKAI